MIKHGAQNEINNFYITGFYTYESSICLTWKLSEGQLELKCKTDNLDLRISFTDPNGKERAYCLLPFPESDCYSHSKYDRIKQDLSTNETTIQVGEKVKENGKWSCFHGTNNEMSSVDITEYNGTGKNERIIKMFKPCNILI